MRLSNKGITKALIRLRVCAGWSAPLLFAYSRRQVFSRRGPTYFYALGQIKSVFRVTGLNSLGIGYISVFLNYFFSGKNI